MIYYQELIKWLLSITVLGGLMTWFIKKVIQKFMQLDLEKYKIKLQTELEIHKNNLQLEQHKYTKLHDEQCEFIKSLYQRLNTVDKLSADFLGLVTANKPLDQKDKEKSKQLAKEIFDLEDFFKENKILLSKQLSESIHNTIQQLFDVTMKSAYALILQSTDIIAPDGKHLGIVVADQSTLSKEDKEKRDQLINEIQNIRSKELPASMTLLENEFRRIFGVK